MQITSVLVTAGRLIVRTRDAHVMFAEPGGLIGEVGRLPVKLGDVSGPV